MKTHYTIFFIIILAMFLSNLNAQDSSKTKDPNTGTKQVFIDKDGDGYNDNAPDHDGDGIPNGLDPDWIKMKKEEKNKEARRFVDLDGDGIDDNLQRSEKAKQRLGAEMNKSAGSMEESSRQQKGQKKQNQNGKK